MDATQENLGDLIKKKELLQKKIHKVYNTSELVPKGLKELRKKLETNSGTHKEEAILIKEIDQLKASIPAIEEKEEIEAKINVIYKAKKEASKNLPAILQEMKTLKEEIDELKKGQEVKIESLETLDK